jgi:hypothetical protein
MPSTNLRDGLPSHMRVQILRRVAAAVIRSAERGRQHLTARRPSIRAEAFVGRPTQTTTEDSTVPPHREPLALPAAPERPYIEADTGERERERVRRSSDRRD